MLAEAWMEPRDLPLSFNSTRAALAATTKMGLTLPWPKAVSRKPVRVVTESMTRPPTVSVVVTL